MWLGCENFLSAHVYVVSRAQLGSTRKRLHLLTSTLMLVLPSIACLLQVYREGRTIEFVKEPVEKLIIARSWTAKQVCYQYFAVQ